MEVDTQAYTLIEDAAGLERFVDQNKNISWLCFDSEFIGEKRFVTLLCLIQISTEHGYFLIDTIKVKDLSPLLKMIEDENIVKITHAGENDFRLLHILFGTVPKNIFDTQIAAGFVGYKYPVSFRKLVDNELGAHLNKGYTVTDWDKRPFKPKMLKYALDDVIYLYELWKIIEKRLKQLGRSDWAKEEFRSLEKAEYYAQDPHKEAISSNIIKSLGPREQLFLIRIYAWRTEEARRRNHSKEMVFPGKLISPIIRAVQSGREALLHNRRLPERLIEKYVDIFLDLYHRKPTEEEKEVMSRIPRDNSDNPKQDILMEMLHLLIRYKCLEENISHSLVMSRTILKKMKADKDHFDDCLENGWRRIFFGEEISKWLKNRNNLTLDFGSGKFELKLK